MKCDISKCRLIEIGKFQQYKQNQSKHILLSEKFDFWTMYNPDIFIENIS